MDRSQEMKPAFSDRKKQGVELVNKNQKYRKSLNPLLSFLPLRAIGDILKLEQEA